ncbi:MAG: ECF-type sigma factor [Phycisphaerales bacterium]
MGPSNQHTTLLLNRVAAGDRAAAEELIPHVYEGLRKLAADYMRRERANHTLQPTALANEALAQLLGSATLDIQNRAHFLAIASRCMRRILVNHAATRNADKRGGGAAALSLEVEPAGGQMPAIDLLAMEDALRRLEALDARKAQIVEHRFFGGMTNAQIAQVLGVSVSTVESDWRTARAWLSAELEA